MNAHLKLFAAAVLTAGAVSIGWAQDTAAPAADKPAAERAAAGQGLRGTAEAPDAEGIRDVLAQATEAALKKDGFNDLVERFVDADRNRLGKAMPEAEARKPLDDLVTQFRMDWKAKYNQEFDFPDKEELVFNQSVKIIQGEFGEAARTAGERTGAPAAEPGADTAAGRAAERTGEAAGKAADKTADAARSAADRAREAAADPDANRERGRNMAVVTIPASHGLPAINVPMIHELPDAWRIDIPDALDAAKLQANLQKQVTKWQGMKTQWPADPNDGYLASSHYVLLAIFEGTPHVQTGAEARPAGETVPPSATPATPATPAAPAPGQ